MIRKGCFLLLILIGFSACAPSAPQRGSCPAGEVCLELGNGTEPATLDPHTATGTWEDRIISEVFVGLTTDDPQGRPIPGMAERWETSADGKVWTFHLRKATWADGVPVTAEDFVFSLQRVLSPERASEYASLVYVIKNAQAVNEGKLPPQALGAKAIDAQTLELTLEHPAPYLLELAKHQTFLPVPKHVVERWGTAWVQPAHIIGNGPYSVKAWRLGDYVLLRKSPTYYASDGVCVDQVRFYPTVDAISAERRVKRGELDLNSDIQSNRIAFLQKTMPGYPRVHTWLSLAYIAFNTSQRNGLPAFRDGRVRQALSMAIDRDFITGKLLRGGQLPAYTFVPPGVANAAPATPAYWVGWPLEKRQAEARRLLKAAGFDAKHPLRFTLKHRNSADPMLFMPAIQADWKAIGVEAKLAQEETQIAYQDYRSRAFEVADASWVADYNDPMSFLYLHQSTTGSQNYSDYRNPAYDAALAQADAEPDVAVRAGHLAKAETLMLADAPVAPIYFYVNKNLVSPSLKGWETNIVDRHRLRFVCPAPTGGPSKPRAQSK